MASKKRQPNQGLADWKKSKQGTNSKNSEQPHASCSTDLLVTERERYLQKECKILTEQIDTYKKRVEHFLQENEFLDKEAQQMQQNSKIYTTYMRKHTQKSQDAVVMLNDQNHSDLSAVRRQKEQMVAHYSEEERKLRKKLMELETKSALMSREVGDLQPYKDLQLEQLIRIRELEKELLLTKIQHTEQMHKVKSRFLQAKSDYTVVSRQKVQTLAKSAEEAAVRCLIQHIKQVKAENWRLRHQLLGLLRRSGILRAYQHQLRARQQQLFREHQYSQALAHLRPWLQRPATRGPAQADLRMGGPRDGPLAQGRAAPRAGTKGQQRAGLARTAHGTHSPSPSPQ
ncbi:PREDICTED: coiled-coil domain-containing protein 166 [Crocodylus porosus]|uniref:coiled-coil domain-containing protein 166 n=1 Tax=Crocodylus porosus TaxID=8502 RepID=UPI00093E560A|nr:PREDICTED: coiled-coil domain-containing protein 166 [Crocodylus porosus]